MTKIIKKSIPNILNININFYEILEIISMWFFYTLYGKRYIVFIFLKISYNRKIIQAKEIQGLS